MPDEFRDHIEPISGSSPLDRVDKQKRKPPAPQVAAGIPGRIIAVRHGAKQHSGDEHTLDVTVGGAETTEIVLRVTRGGCAGLEGKRAVLYIDE